MATDYEPTNDDDVRGESKLKFRSFAAKKRVKIEANIKIRSVSEGPRRASHVAEEDRLGALCYQVITIKKWFLI